MKLILSQPPLPIGLHAQGISNFGLRIWFGLDSQGRFTTEYCDSLSKSEIRNSKFIWYRRRDSNPHCLVPKTSASSRLGYARRYSAALRLSIATLILTANVCAA